jgi:hypothetical protein
MAVADAWKFYRTFRLWLGDKTYNLASDTFNMALFLSTSNAADLTQSLLAGLTFQHANANGYLTGGKSMTGISWALNGAVPEWKFSNTVWTASGGPITARLAVVYMLGTANGRTNPLVCYSLLDSTPADVTAGDTNTFTVQGASVGFLNILGQN